MFRAYIDESCKDGLFAMAGYLASADSWSAFSSEWEQFLGLGPPYFRRIVEVKMSEMTSPLGLEQCELFYRLIEKYAVAQVSCCIRIADLKAAYQKISWPPWLDNLEILTNEHFNAFETIVKGLATNSHFIGVSEAVDIVFDEHTNQAKCLRAWKILKSRGHPDILPFLGSTPTFKDSKLIMPLQAADILAYWARKAAQAPDTSSSKFVIDFPWRKKVSIPGIHIFFEPTMIERNLRNIVLACSLARYGVHPRTISAVVSP